MRSRTIAKPTARSTWAPGSRYSSRQRTRSALWRSLTRKVSRRSSPDKSKAAPRGSSSSRSASNSATTRCSCVEVFTTENTESTEKSKIESSNSVFSVVEIDALLISPIQSRSTGLPAWKRGQPGQVGNEAAPTVATSAGVRLVNLHPASHPAVRASHQLVVVLARLLEANALRLAARLAPAFGLRLGIRIGRLDARIGSAFRRRRQAIGNDFDRQVDHDRLGRRQR